MHHIKKPTDIFELDYDNKEGKQKIRYHLKSVGGNKCMTCGRNFSDREGRKCTIEHIKPKGQFPEFRNSFENMITICHKCNSERINTIEVLVPTQLDRYNEYIYINEYTGEIKAIESEYKERIENTIKSYKLNREELNKTRKTMNKMLNNGMSVYYVDKLYNYDDGLIPFLILNHLKIADNEQYETFISSENIFENKAYEDEYNEQ